MGNHELLNLQGMTRYVHPGELEEFGGAAAWKRALHPINGELGTKLLAQVIWPATPVGTRQMRSDLAVVVLSCSR